MAQWKKGQSGNPNGRPRGARAVLDVIGPETGEAILRKLAERAVAGDVAAAKVLLERTDPAPRRQETSEASLDEIAFEFERAFRELENFCPPSPDAVVVETTR